MSSHNNPYISRPRTIKELGKKTEEGIQWSDRYELKKWLKGTLNLVRTAEQHERDGDLEMAFVLMARAATVILEKLPTHPEFQTSLSSIEKANLRHNGETYLKTLSRIKLILLQRFDEWHRQHPEWTMELEKELSSQPSSSGSTPSSTNTSGPPSYGTLVDRPSSTPASNQRRDPNDFIKKNKVHWGTDELRYTHDRKDAGTTREPSANTRSSIRREGGLEDELSRMRISNPPVTSYDSYRTPEWYGQGSSAAWQVPSSYISARPSPSHQGPISYPMLSDGHRHSDPYIPSYPRYDDYGQPSRGSAIPPPLPPPPIPGSPYSHLSLPTRRLSTPSFPPLPIGVGEYYGTQSGTAPPSSNRTTTSSTTGKLGRSKPPPPPPPPPPPSASRTGLRRLLMPFSILSTFLDIAQPQTSRKIETCALLLGTSRERGSLDNEELVVEVLLVPKQKGGSDTCQMEEEEMVVEVQLERGLIALGWIHTHPTQSCFMSSMDLHTHAAYQQTLPEAVAIVCAPRGDPSFGIFRLTEPSGLSAIIQCKRSALFHEHPDVDGGIYTDADGGHVRLTSGGGVEGIDLRRK